ncbi:DNA polymerase III subunit alpha [Bartonella sp. DGB1]|uniref:DNA polymerase III subunit alpha n=1 Tax=Bartonella sp. DGB1 TaxID=3239807 RepID=UPI00352630AD
MKKHDVSFIPLRVHSSYSLLASTLKIDQIINKCRADNIPAVAVTDINNLFGSFEFSQKAIKAGVQPIIACQFSSFYYDNNSLYEGDIILLAQNKQGYENLLQLASLIYIHKDPTIEQGKVALNLEWLDKYNQGLILLTGGDEGIINNCCRNKKFEIADKLLNILIENFPKSLYIELQRYQGYNQDIENQLITLADKYHLPLVATNNIYFLSPADYVAHDALLAIADGTTIDSDDRRRATLDNYFKSSEEMCELFKDIPEALENTIEIAYRCHIYVESRPPLLPRFISSQDDKRDILVAEADELTKQAKEGLAKRLIDIGPAKGYSKQDYEDRLDYELSIIIKMQFPGYFLIVADFIKWAKQNSIPVGPGRGSGAGSLVAYALTITNIDPLRFSLLFERFLNPDRISMPDFDIDFCQDRRGEVIRYVQNKYGDDHVAQIITFGSLQARAAIRDVGRVLGVPYGQVDRLSKLIPQNPANPISLAQAIMDEPALRKERDEDEQVNKLLEIATKLEGLPRHASVHAAGIVIGDRPLAKLVPLYSDPRSEMNVTQFNMKFVEQAGLVKFDFLGLKTLTVLQNTVSLVAQRGININLDSLPLDDKLTYELLSRGETTGIFQIESAGMRKALIGMKPDCIEDIIALVALYRPGPMENIPIYNDRKNKIKKITSIHPLIDHLLAETQGVIVYQEQVMQIAQILAGYSLGEADLLRRAMGKKIHTEMEQQRARFVEGAKKNNLNEQQANDIFDLLAKFADYGFNKSHAAAYAYISYQTAYLKAHFPAEFLATSLTYDMSNADKVNDYLKEAKRLKIEVIFPSVQTSSAYFSVKDNKIIYALSALKGVGEEAAKHIVEVRGNTEFADINDFCARIDPQFINKRVYESLIFSGALDCFNIEREQLFAGLESMQMYALRLLQAKTNGQGSLFTLDENSKDEIIFPKFTKWNLSEKLQKEFQILGFYLSSHPLQSYQKLLQDNNVIVTEKLLENNLSRAKIAGTIISKTERKTKNGNKMAIVVFSDCSGQYEATLFSELLENNRQYLYVGNSLIFDVKISRNNETDTVDLRIESIVPLNNIFAKNLIITLNNTESITEITKKIPVTNNAKTNLIFVIKKNREWKEVIIDTQKKVEVNLDELDNISTLAGVETVTID